MMGGGKGTGTQRLSTAAKIKYRDTIFALSWHVEASKFRVQDAKSTNMRIDVAQRNLATWPGLFLPPGSSLW